MAGAKKNNIDKAPKNNEKNKQKAKGNSNSKDEKANDPSSSKLKAATAINSRHILVWVLA